MAALSDGHRTVAQERTQLPGAIADDLASGRVIVELVEVITRMANNGAPGAGTGQGWRNRQRSQMMG